MRKNVPAPCLAKNGSGANRHGVVGITRQLQEVLVAVDPKGKEWSIWWFDGRYPGSLDPPVKGQFANGVGTFLARDSYQGVPVVVRFVWNARDAKTPRWEQAFSKDDGATWETNWIMVFTQTS